MRRTLFQHHLYTEEDLGPAEEVESDRQQRVYRGQPATLGQVARDRDGLSRHSNALQVAPGNGREKLSVISFGTQQQYRTDSETEDVQSNDLAEHKRREKRQTKFSFPGNTRTAHPSVTVGATSWAAASPHFPPLATPQLPPPPPPSWPVYTSHYNQANKSPVISNNYNSARNRHTFTPSKFSKPIRFPIQDNENDFVPIIGQGVKLPKPSPGLLITPSSIEKENQTGTSQNKQHPHHLVSLSSLENQPDNYVFFNLETSPNSYSKNNRPNQNVVNNSMVPFLLKIQLFQNQTHVINNIQNSNSTNGKDKANFNLSEFALDSEKTQVSSPNYNADVNHKNDKNGERGSEIKPVVNFNLAQLDSDKSLPHRVNVKNNVNNLPQHSQYYTEHGNSEEYKDKDQTSKYEFEKDTLKSDEEGLEFSVPPKNVYEYQKYKYQNVNNSFSNPVLNFGNYFDELNDQSASKNATLSVQNSGHSLGSSNDNDDKINTNRYKTKARKPNNFQQEGNLNKTHPGLIKMIQYQPLTEELLHEQRQRYKIQTQGIGDNFNFTTRNVPQTGFYNTQPYFNKTYSKYNNHYQSLKDIPKPLDLVSKEFENPNYQVTGTITDYSDYTQRPLEDTIVDTYTNDVSIPSNHKYIENINIPPSHSFNFSDEANEFKPILSKHTTAHPIYYKDFQYNISDEEPTLFSVHRENSLSDPPHNKHKRSKQEDSLYDDEDYYGSDEDYYSDEFSIENLHSPVNKEVKPPDIPKKLNNIDFLTFDKSNLYDDYDEASIEEEDESERDDYLSSSYNKGEIFDCNKYKNHKCNTTESIESDYDQSEGSEEYDYDEEDIDGESNKSTKPANYAVVENIAESQQLFTKSVVKSDPANNKNHLPNSSGLLALNGSPFVNKPTNSLLSFPRTNPNKTSDIPPTLLTYQNNKLGENIYQDVLLKTASVGKGFYNTSVFTNGTSTSSDEFKNLPKIIQRHNTSPTHLRNITFRPNTAKLNKSLHMTTDSSKLHSATTLPFIPKSLKHLRQRPLTQRTNFTHPQTGQRPMTLLTFNSHLTKPLRVNGRQSIAPPYIEPTTTRVTARGYNATQQQQQQYTPSPYDPYYNIYEDEADLYKDIGKLSDYSQYSGQQNQQYQKQSPVVQQQVQATPSRKPSVQYSPPPPQQSYNAVQQDVYSQSVGAQDYSDNYNLQDEDIDYKQSDIDLKSNRSRSTKREEAVKTPDGAEKERQKQVQRNFPRNRHLTLTAAFSFEDEKFPVTSSKQLEENVRQRSNSFRVEDPPSSGPSRDTHELVLNYLRQENPTSTEKPKISDETKTISEINANRGSVNVEYSKKDNQPKPFSYYLDDLDTSHISSTPPPKRDTNIEADFGHQSKSRPFRIIVPSSTSNPLRNPVTESDQVTDKPKYTIRRGNRYHYDNTETSTPAIETPSETVKPYKLPPLTKETIESLPIQLSSQTTQESVENFRRAYQRNMEEQTGTRRRLPNINNEFSKTIQDENIQFVPVNPSRSLQEDSIALARTHRFQNRSRITENTPKIINRQHAQLSTEIESPSKEINSSDLSSNLKSGRQTSTRIISRQHSTASTTEESIFKFIPIQAVKSRDDYEASQNQETQPQKIHIDDLRPDVTTNTVQPRKTGNNLYQVTEDIESYTPLYHATKRKYHTHTTEEPTDNNRKSNILNSEDIIIKENNKDSAYDFSSTTRTPVRFFQTTEKVVPKPVYSLKIDRENNAQVGGFILATLETITVPPVDSKSANDNAANIRKTSSIEQKHTVGNNQDGNSGGTIQNEQQNSYYAIGNIQNNQIRIRNRVRPATRNGFKNEYNAYSTSVEQSTEYNHDEQVTITTARPRIRKPQDSIINPSTESTPLNNINEQEKLDAGRRIINSRTNTKINPSKERNGNDDEHFNTEVDSVADLESVNYNQRRRQLKNRNRLQLVTEEQGDRQESDNIDFNSEEDITFNNKEPSFGIESLKGDNDATDLNQRNTNFSLEAQYIPRRIKTLSSAAVTNRAEAATEGYDEDSISDFAQDRQSNVRKMHIRKKVWKTTIQPQSSTDNYNIEDNSSTNRPYIDSGRQNNYQRLPVEPYGDNEIKSTTQTVRDTGSNRQDNSPSFRNRDEFVNNRNYHFKNNEDQYLGRGNGQFEKKENSNLKANRPTLATVTVDPYELIKSSSNDNKSNRSRGYDQTTFTTQKPVILRNGGTETRPTLESKPLSPLAMEINSYFKELVQNSTFTNTTDMKVSTTPYPMTTVERIRDKFRLGNFPKPTPPSSTFARKPSVEDITPPPLPSDRCSQELDNDSECNEKPLLRVRPTPASPDSQATPGLTR
ncbi:Polysaccharide deacetylase [Homalodisca vitripennis]|nr:Polysaccharide deacetylase [Homalodisca vitripennis]